MWFKNITPSWYYIDPTQRYTGVEWDPAQHDGSSIENADRQLPNVLQDNTVYLIRRSNHKYIVEEGESNPLVYCYNHTSGCNLASSSAKANRVAIIGMPKADHPLYQYMPEAAKIAWGADVWDYAVLAENPASDISSRQHTVNLHANRVVITNLMIKRLYRYFEHERSNSIYGFIGGSSDDFTFSDIYACTTNSDWLNPDERNGVLLTRRDCYGWKSPRLIHMDYTNTCHVHDCILLNSPDARDDGAYIYLYSRFGNCSIHDITLHNMSFAANGNTTTPGIHRGFFCIDRSGYFQDTGKLDVYNIKEYIWRSTSSSSESNCRSPLRGIVNGGANNIHVRDIIIEMMDEDQQFATNYPPNAQWLACDLGSFNPGNIIENITANLPECAGGINFVAFKEQRNDGTWDKYFTPKSQWHIIRNINFLGTPSNETPKWGNNNSTSVHISSDRYSYDNRNYGSVSPTCGQIIVQNINVKAYWGGGTAVYLASAMLDMVNNHIEGRVDARSCTGKIGSIKVYQVGNAFYDSYGGNLLYIGSITCNRNNPSEEYIGQQAISPSWASQILVGSTNTKFLADDNFSNDITNANDHMYLCTSDTLEGNFVARNRISKAETWSVYRTGGHSCTLRLLNEISDASGTPLRIGDKPFAGIKRRLEAGINKCTFYFTTYGYNDPSQLKNKIRIRAMLPSGLYVGGDGIWEEDTTTEWNNVELNTSFTYTMYIDMPEAGDVQFNYAFWWFMKGGYTFMDPFPAIELVQ